MNFFCCFLQRKACYTELAILETLICTKEHRRLAHQAVPNCLRLQLHYIDDTLMPISKLKASSPNKTFLTVSHLHILQYLPVCFVSFIHLIFPHFQNQHKGLLAVNR